MDASTPAARAVPALRHSVARYDLPAALEQKCSAESHQGALADDVGVACCADVDDMAGWADTHPVEIGLHS